MKNKEVAQALNEIGELLSLEGGNVFRIRAYERAAQVVDSLPDPIEDIVRENKLEEIGGIGESIAQKIREYVDTGKIAYLEELKNKFPQGLLRIMSVPGMGPKKAKALYEKLHINSIEELQNAARSGEIEKLPGFGKKTEDNILKGINLVEKSAERILLSEAMPIAREIIRELKTNKFIEEIDPAGSLRRYKETIGDIDILCSVKKGHEQPVIDQFMHLPQVQRVIAAGETKISVITVYGRQVDLRIVQPGCYGAALLYFTGSKAHNISLRTMAKQRGLTINEYGIFKVGHKDRPIACRTEADMYHALGLAYIPPELRENAGEIEAAAKNELPTLIELKDIKGDTHVHSNYSDGFNTIEEMANKARSLGYEWVVMCDHSQSLKIARGLSVERVHQKLAEIDRLNAKNKNFRILKGVEIDILEHGNLDYPRAVLEKFDFVVASVHTGFKQPEKKITGRIVRALENPFTNCLGHPTGRLLNKRSPYAVDLEKVLDAARDNRKLLEINAFPDRLDLYDIYCREAAGMGIRMSIGTDAHSVDHLQYMELGVAVARRGWLEKKDIINTLSYKELMHYLHSMRETVTA